MWFGEDRSARPQAVCPDKRKDCLQVVREAASQARHLPSRFHLVLVFTKRAETWSPGKAHHGQLRGSLRESPENTDTALSTHQPDDLSGSGCSPTRSGRIGPESRRSQLGPVFVADDHGSSLAVRASDGQLPWSRRLNARVRALPMTQMVRGTRFAVIAPGKEVAALALSSGTSR